MEQRSDFLMRFKDKISNINHEGMIPIDTGTPINKTPIPYAVDKIKPMNHSGPFARPLKMSELKGMGKIPINVINTSFDEISTRVDDAKSIIQSERQPTRELMVPEPRLHQGVATTIPSSKKKDRRARSIELPPIKRVLPKVSKVSKAITDSVQVESNIDSYANRSKARSRIDYKPYNLDQYKASFVSDRYTELGGIGPQVGTKAWNTKKGLYDKGREFAKKANKDNVSKLPKIPKPRWNEDTEEDSANFRAKKFAKSIKRPKLKVLNKTSQQANIALMIEHPALSRSYF